MAEMIAPFLIEQADFAVAGADANPDAATGGQRGRASGEDLYVGLGAVDVAPERRLVADDGEQASAADGAIAARMHADNDIAPQPHFFRGHALDLLAQDR